MSLRSRVLLLAALMAFSPVIEQTAQAAAQSASSKGKADKGKKKGGKNKNAEVQVTGIDSFDSVFAQVAPIDATLDSVDVSLRSTKLDLISALGLEKGTPLKDALASLQQTAGNKVNLVMKGTVPSLAVTDAVPANVQSAVDAVNSMTSTLVGSLDDLEALPSQVSALISQTAGFPGQLKSELTSGGLSELSKLPKATTALTADLDLVTGLPDRVSAVTNRTTEILSVVQSSFAPSKK
jgi:hypothetical protein